MDSKEKFVMSLNYIFGKDICSAVDLDNLKFSFSKRTGRLKNVEYNNILFATLRSDGSIALTVYGASILVKNPLFLENCVVIENGPDIFVSVGKSVFAKHVVMCGNRVRPSSDVAILDKHNNVIAVGKSFLSAKMMKALERGVAVKIRECINRNVNVALNI